MSDLYELMLQFNAQTNNLNALDEIAQKVQSIRASLITARKELHFALEQGDTQKWDDELDKIHRYRQGLGLLASALDEIRVAKRDAFASTQLPLFSSDTLRSAESLKVAMADVGQVQGEIVREMLGVEQGSAHYRELQGYLDAVTERTGNLTKAQRALHAEQAAGVRVPSLGAETWNDRLSVARRISDLSSARDEAARGAATATTGTGHAYFTAQQKEIQASLRETQRVYDSLRADFAKSLAVSPDVLTNVESAEAHLQTLQKTALELKSIMASTNEQHIFMVAESDLKDVEQQARRVSSVVKGLGGGKAAAVEGPYTNKFAIPLAAMGDMDRLREHMQLLSAESKRLKSELNAGNVPADRYKEIKREQRDLREAMAQTKAMHKELRSEVQTALRPAAELTVQTQQSGNILRVAEDAKIAQNEVRRLQIVLEGLLKEQRALRANPAVSQDSEAWITNELAIRRVNTELAGYRKQASLSAAITKDTSKSAESAAKSFDQFTHAIHGSSRQTAIALSSSVALAAARAGLAAAMGAATLQALREAAAYQMQQTAFDNLLQSHQRGSRMLSELNTFAADTQYRFDELTAAAKRMLAYGFGADKVIPVLRTIGDAVSALGGSSEMLDRVVVAMGQIMAKGKLSAEEMRQLAEAGIPAWKFVAESMGKSTREVMEMSKKGMISSSEALNAILKGMGENFGGMMERQSRTIYGRYTTLADNLQILMRDLGSTIVEKLDITDRMGALIIDIKSFGDLVKQVGIRDAIAIQFDPRAIQLLHTALAAVSAFIATKAILIMVSFAGTLVDVGDALINAGRAVIEYSTALKANLALNIALQGTLRGTSTVLGGMLAGVGKLTLALAIITGALWLLSRAYDAVMRNMSGVSKEMEEEVKLHEESARQSYQAYTAEQKLVEAKGKHVDMMRTLAQEYLDLKDSLSKAAKGSSEYVQQHARLAEITVLLNGHMSGLTATLDGLPKTMSNAEKATKALAGAFSEMEKAKFALGQLDMKQQLDAAKLELINARNAVQNYHNAPPLVRERLVSLDKQIAQQRSIIADPLAYAQANMSEWQRMNPLQQFSGSPADLDAIVTKAETSLAGLVAQRESLAKRYASPEVQANVTRFEDTVRLLTEAIRAGESFQRAQDNGIPTITGGDAGDKTPKEKSKSPMELAQIAVREAQDALAASSQYAMQSLHNQWEHGTFSEDQRRAMQAQTDEQIRQESLKILQKMFDALEALTVKERGKNNASLPLAALSSGGSISALIDKLIPKEALAKYYTEQGRATITASADTRIKKGEFSQDTLSALDAATLKLNAQRKDSLEWQAAFVEREKILADALKQQADDALTSFGDLAARNDALAETDADRVRNAARLVGYRKEEYNLIRATLAGIHDESSVMSAMLRPAQRNDLLKLESKAAEAVGDARRALEKSIAGEVSRQAGEIEFNVRQDRIAAVVDAMLSSLRTMLGERADEFAAPLDEALNKAAQSLRKKVATGLPGLVGDTFTAMTNSKALTASGGEMATTFDPQSALQYLQQQRDLWGDIALQIDDAALRGQVLNDVDEKLAAGTAEYAKHLKAAYDARKAMGEFDTDPQQYIALLNGMDVLAGHMRDGEAFIRDLKSGIITVYSEQADLIVKQVRDGALQVAQADSLLLAARASLATLEQTVKVKQQIEQIDAARIDLAKRGYDERMAEIARREQTQEGAGTLTVENKASNDAERMAAREQYLQQQRDERIQLLQQMNAARANQGPYLTQDADQKHLSMLDREIDSNEAALSAEKARATEAKRLYDIKQGELRTQIALAYAMSQATTSSKAQAEYALKEEAVRIAALKQAADTAAAEYQHALEVAGVTTSFDALSANTDEMTGFVSASNSVPQQVLEKLLAALRAKTDFQMAQSGMREEAIRSAGDLLDSMAVRNTTPADDRERRLAATALDQQRAEMSRLTEIVAALVGQWYTPQSLVAQRRDNPYAFEQQLNTLSPEKLRMVSSLLEKYDALLSKEQEFAERFVPGFANALFDYARDRNAIRNYFSQVGQEMQHGAIQSAWKRFWLDQTKPGAMGPSWMSPVNDLLVKIFGGIIKPKEKTVTLPDGGVVTTVDRAGQEKRIQAAAGNLIKSGMAISGLITDARGMGTAAAQAHQGSSGAQMQGAMSGAMTGYAVADLFKASPLGLAGGAVLGGLFGLFEAQSAYDREMKRLNQEQLDELKKINNKLSPVSDYFQRGSYSALTRTIAYGATMGMEQAWAVAQRRGYR